MRKDIIKSLIAIKQKDMPFNIINRDKELPINRKKIITIPGVRRCGKSTLMEIAINELLKTGIPKENILWLGFDDERLKKMTSDDLDEVLNAYREMYPDISLTDVHMFFDEIQIIEDWEYFVLRVYKSYCKNIYISGSNATMLSTELSTALRGYPLEYATTPLSFHEYCHFIGINTNSYLEQDIAKIKNAFLEYNKSSSFPEIVLTKSAMEKIMILNGYYETMILKDLVEHYKISKISILKYFIKRIMSNLSKPTSINAIYNDIKSQGLKVSKDELYLWANYICSIFMFLRVPKYEYSLSKEEQSLAKFYSIDNGLYKAILLPRSDDNGKLLENTVLLQLYREKTPFSKIYYYKGNVECDFVVQENECVNELIQVTWDMYDEETRKRETAGILEASKVTNCNNLTIITSDEETTIISNEKVINVVPAWKWLLRNHR